MIRLKQKLPGKDVHHELQVLEGVGKFWNWKRWHAAGASGADLQYALAESPTKDDAVANFSLEVRNLMRETQAEGGEIEVVEGKSIDLSASSSSENKGVFNRLRNLGTDMRKMIRQTRQDAEKVSSAEGLEVIDAPTAAQSSSLNSTPVDKHSTATAVDTIEAEKKASVANVANITTASEATDAMLRNETKAKSGENGTASPAKSSGVAKEGAGQSPLPASPATPATPWSITLSPAKASPSGGNIDLEGLRAHARAGSARAAVLLKRWEESPAE